MKKETSVKYIIESQDDLDEALNDLEFRFEPNDIITQVGSYGDVRPSLMLLELIEKKFKDIKTLRAKDPDLLTRFKEITDKLSKLSDEFIKNDEIISKHFEKDNQ